MTGIDPFHIGAMAGRQLPLLSLAVPFWLVFMMDGLRGVRQILPAALVAGGSFAVTQYFTSNHIGRAAGHHVVARQPVALAAFLKVWQPRTAKQTAGGLVASGGGAALGASAARGRATASAPARAGRRRRTRADRARVVAVPDPDGRRHRMEHRAVQALFAAHGALASTVLKFHVAGPTSSS